MINRRRRKVGPYTFWARPEITHSKRNYHYYEEKGSDVFTLVFSEGAEPA